MSSAKDIAGSILKLAINGISFRVAADSNVSMPPSEFENSNIPTSGDNMQKMTKRARDLDGIVITANSDELETLSSLADSMTQLTLSVTNAAGDTLRNTGKINLDTHESEENRVTVKMLPKSNKWKVAVGEVTR